MNNKKKREKVFMMALLLLVGITSIFVAGTYAKYTATVNGSGTATVAKWAFDTDNASASTLAINFSQSYDASTLVANRIAPGTSGSFGLELKNTNSEVGVDFTVSFTGVTNAPSNIVFKKGTTTIDPTSGTITGQIKPGDTITVPINWEWPYYTSAADDTEDTTDGKAAKTMTLNATITGVQTSPSTAAITTHVD